MFRYSLDKSPKKYPCPECGKKRLVRYRDEKTGSLMPSQYGRCDREINCGYHFRPTNEKTSQEKYATTHSRPKQKPVMFPLDVMQKTLKGYDKNVFIQNLLQKVESGIMEHVAGLYYLGTISNGYRAGAVTFPFIDVNGQIRAIQAKQFDNNNHTISTDFLHSILERYYASTGESIPAWLPKYMNQDLKVSCLFGEHLLSKYPYNHIALVEAPKTAVYGAAYFGLPTDPNRLLWLAVYNLSSLNIERCRVLAGRKVTLFPDLSVGGKAFKLWSDRTDKIRKEIEGNFHVSEFLEWIASDKDRENGMDLADYLDKSEDECALDLLRLKNPTIDRLLDFFGQDAEISVEYSPENPNKLLIDYRRLFVSAMGLTDTESLYHN